MQRSARTINTTYRQRPPHGDHISAIAHANFLKHARGYSRQQSTSTFEHAQGFDVMSLEEALKHTQGSATRLSTGK